MIAVTGAGVVSAIGLNKAESLDALRSGRSGIGKVRWLRTDHTEFPVGEVPASNDELKRLLGITHEPTTRSQLLGVMAAREALHQAFPPEDPNLAQNSQNSQKKLSTLNSQLSTLKEVALISGTTVGGMDAFEEHYPQMLMGEGGWYYLMSHDCGACTRMIADALFSPEDQDLAQNSQNSQKELLTPNSSLLTQKLVATPSTACSSALNAIILGCRMLESGRVDVVIAGGTECLTRFHLNGFKSLMILDERPCRPFDKERAGLNLGEGAGYLVLEREEDALARSAKVLAKISGCGNACDAFHQTATSANGDGALRAMTQALNQAGLQPSDIDYVNAHGTGTPNNDASESAALRSLFADRMPAVSSTKALTGHATSASGGIEAVFCLMAMQEGFIPPQPNFTQADPACIVPQTEPAQAHLRHVLCNSFGFGGNDSAIILSTPNS